MKKQLLNISLAILLFLAACSKETELQKSVFIPDKDYPSLPAYSEWGTIHLAHITTGNYLSITTLRYLPK